MELNVNNLLLTIKELLVAWINSILYYHQVYPKSVFEEFQSFNVIIHKSRSPKLNDYIEGLIDDFLQLLTKGEINEFIVVLFANNNKVYHKYVINFTEFLDLSTKVHQEFSSTIKLPGLTWDNIYKQFNSFLFYSLQDLKLQEFIVDLNFKILINTNANLNKSPQWVYTPSISTSAKLKPLSEVSVGIVNFNCHHEFEK